MKAGQETHTKIAAKAAYTHTYNAVANATPRQMGEFLGGGLADTALFGGVTKGFTVVKSTVTSGARAAVNVAAKPIMSAGQKVLTSISNFLGFNDAKAFKPAYNAATNPPVSASIKVEGLLVPGNGGGNLQRGVGSAVNYRNNMARGFEQKKSSKIPISIFEKIPAPRTPGLGTHASINELLSSGAIPGVDGVIITDRFVKFADLYKLSTLKGRKIEFSLSKEIINGHKETVLRSGSALQAPVTKTGRPIAHTHPTENLHQKWASEADMSVLNRYYFKQLEKSSTMRPEPHRIIWGPGNCDNTIVYPGFGKDFRLIPKG